MSSTRSRALAILALAALPAMAAAAAGDELLSDSTSSAEARWGGVAEWRSVVLRSTDEASVRVHQGVLRLTYERSFGSGPQLAAHAQWQQLHASDAQTLQRLQQAGPVADRSLRLTHTRRSARSDQTLGFDWLYLQGNWRHGRYAVGRQPINPSIGRLWSPADLFAPFHPNDLERLYKPGVDAAQGTYFIAEHLALTSIASTARRDDGSIRWNWQQRVELEAAWGKSFVLAGGRSAQKVLGVGGQVNDVAGNDLYAELLWHRGPNALPNMLPRVDERRTGVRALFGASRKLATNTLGSFELFHQSLGTPNPSLYDIYAQRAAGIDLPAMGVGRWYAGMSVSARPHPLIGLDLLLLANLDDRSSSATAAFEYTPLPNLKLRSTLSTPLSGAAVSEYRSQGLTLQLGLQWFY